jgi:DNA-binding MarR family transcriptional regulator
VLVAYISTVDHDVNVLGAAALLLADRMRAAVEATTRLRGETASALTALLAWGDGLPIEALASGLHLSHSRTVRVVDALEARGDVVRRRDPADRRRAVVALTAQGRRAAKRVLRAREAALQDALSSLSAAEVGALAGAGSTLLAQAATTRAEARHLCRWCDVSVCGFDDGRCPSIPERAPAF